MLDRNTVFAIAQIYQRATGIRLPFSKQDPEIMVRALEESFKREEERYRYFQKKSQVVDQCIRDIQRCEIKYRDMGS